jgi:hypothetical protein
MERMVSDRPGGLMTVRLHLDAWRGGMMGAGAREGDFAPVAEGDLVRV